MNKGTEISKEEFDKLSEQGVATMYDCPCECEHKSETNCCKECYQGFSGFFEAQDKAQRDIILVCTNEGYFIRAREDLVKSEDEITVAFCEEVKDGENCPCFEDIFEVREGL